MTNHPYKAFHQHMEKYYQDKAYRLDEKNVITVLADIVEFLVCVPDHKGRMHQHFYINIKELLSGHEEMIDTKLTFVSVYYGNEEGLKEPVPNIEPGKSIVIKGKYIPASKAYKTEDNPGFAVLHFTHHPLGYIEYEGKHYE